jgi:TrmH family RNA methyltransferase
MNRKQTSTSANAQILGRVRSLSRRSVRDREHSFWIEGIRQFVQAFDSRLDFSAVVYSPILLKSALAEMLIRRLAAAGVPRYRVSPEEFRSVGAALHASGVGAIVRQHWTPLDVAAHRQGLGWLIVESIRSPGNLGTMLRTAEAAGMSGVIFVGPDCDPFDPVVVRACMGGMFPLPLVRVRMDELAKWGTQQQIQLVGLSPEAEQLWSKAPLTKNVGLVLGEERSGLSEPMRKLCRTTVRLPMTGTADSLNVAMAASVMMYELVRRAQPLA